MESHARLLGHPVHQTLVVFPLGLLGTAVIFDLLARFVATPELGLAAHWMTLAGIVGAVLAAPFGFIDWLHVPKGTRARRIGALHGGGNLVVSLLFVASWLMRDPDRQASIAALSLSVLGLLLALVTAWLGGELVDRLGIGVSDAAGPDAPSSLRSTHAPRKHVA